MKVYFVTSNKNKFKEAKKILGSNLEMATLELEEIQHMDTEEVTNHKIKEAYTKLKKPACVDDTGLYLDAIKGLPGAFAKHFTNRLGAEGISNLVSLYGIYTATVSTSLGFSDGIHTKIFTSRIKGMISKVPAGKTGFGFDSVFIPKGSNLTLAQMSITYKNRFSARGTAFKELKEYLESQKII
jgi:non-canonical purine NTP pyrophosphatase (RdgB/HAM1 family)